MALPVKKLANAKTGILNRASGPVFGRFNDSAAIC
jgi:hypothetical protein